MSRRLFVTGMPRSGTTLLDKILSMHPQAHVFSQPLPLLYVRLKRAFLDSRRDSAHLSPAVRRYPLNDSFASTYSCPDDLKRFLAALLLDAAFCRSVLEEMQDFDGRYTAPSEPSRVLDGYRSAPLDDFTRHYLDMLRPSLRAEVVGSKEVSCEEFVPYYLGRGFRVLQIVRDPRDVVASLDFGEGPRFAGGPKPLLFNLRQWRKSVAFALALRRDSGFLTVSYEELVRDPNVTLARITEFLELRRFPSEYLDSDLRSQSGDVWRSNSSHGAVSRIGTLSVGRYRSLLRSETDLFVQAVCYPELKVLGYEVAIEEDQVESILSDYQERRAHSRPELSGYSWGKDRLEEELVRWNALRGDTFDPRYFLFEGAFSRLRSTLSSPKE